MTVPVRPLNLSSFTGGLNLRGDAFALKDSESPDLLNVDLDPRGGVRSRRGWTKWNASAESSWAPKRLHIWEKADGTHWVMVVNNSKVRVSSNGTFADLSDASGVVDPAATTHGADFADWSDTVYIACGNSKQTRSWGGSGNAVKITANATGVWEDDYTAPDGTPHFPKCDFVTTYQGYMVCASTNEDGTAFPNRVRFSHPNNPTNWKNLDRIDINNGGAKITGIVAFSDHVVIFKTNSVWAIYGNDIDSFTPVNITNAVGAIHRNAIVVTDTSAFFYSHPNGVHEYVPGSGITELSEQLRPIIDSGALTASALGKMFLGYLNRRLWWGVPYEPTATATDVRSVFVYDPSIKAWTLYRDADGDGLGPFATGGNQGDGALLLACHRAHGFVLSVEANSIARDTIDAGAVGFPTLYATRWLHANWPSLKKSWRRPDYVVTEESSAWNLSVGVYRDYDESIARSAHTVNVSTGAAGAVWGAMVWGAFVWGGTPTGAHIERGGSIGLAKAIQLRFSGQVGLPWGLNAVVCKFRPRKFH